MKNFIIHLRSRTLAGIIVLIPLSLTLLVLKFIWDATYALITPLFDLAVLGMPENISTYFTRSLVVILVILFLYIFGSVTPTFIGRQFSSFLMGLLERIPIVRGIYRVSKLFTAMFTGDKNRETNRVVLLEYPSPGIQALGIVTGKFISYESKEKLAVYIPTVPNPTSGFLAMVYEHQVTDTNMDFDEAMQIVISGGLLTEEISKKRAEN